MRTLARPRFVSRALALLLAALPSACGSTGSKDSSGPAQQISVELVGYGPSPFVLVSESHTSRVELYSEERDTASTKVLDDEVMAALVEHLDELGFAGYSRPGTAPAMGGGSAIAKAIQIENGDRHAWWPLSATAGASELKNFNTAVRDFLSLYNIAQGWQSVDNSLGGEYFDQKKAKGGH